MSWRDDINRALTETKKAAGIPAEDESKDKAIEEVLKKLWEDARSFDPAWDSD